MKMILRAIGLLFISATISTQSMGATYVSDFQKISLREAPSASNAIIKMLPTDTRVTVLETQGEWAKIKSEDSEGWVHIRGLSQDTPVRDRLTYTEKKLEDAYAALKGKGIDQQGLVKERDEARAQLASKDKELVAVKDELEKLTAASGNVVKLQKDYKAAALQSNDLYVRNQQLEEKLGERYMLWFLAGAGVLVLGMLFGRNARKNSYSSNLRF